MRSIEVRSYAKVNLYLDVLDRRLDGYHNLDTLFTEINIYDLLTFQEDEHSVRFKCSCEEINNTNNHVYKAVKLLQQKSEEYHLGVSINLDKRLPFGAGLGSGSSNAAYTLLTLNDLWKLNYSKEELSLEAEKIGADVPYFIHGGVARGTNIGNELTLLDDISMKLHFIIIFPNQFISTKECYKRLDNSPVRNNLKDKKKIKDLIIGLKTNNFSAVADNLYNRFEDAVYSEHWFINVREMLLKVGAVKTLLCGSGSAQLGLFENEQSAIKGKSLLTNCEAYLASTHYRKDEMVHF